MVELSELLLITHATIGGLSLISGTVTMFLPKGQKAHFTWGNVFYWSLVFTGFSAIIMSCLPGHGSLFLFLIGGMSIYFAWSGKRMLRWKKRKSIRWRDQALVALIFGIALIFLLSPILQTKDTSWMFYIFGGGCLFFAYWDYTLLMSLNKRKLNWLKNHLSKMVSGYIASWSAFLVVNDTLPYNLNWFAASLIGVPFIILWTKRVDTKEKWQKLIHKNIRRGKAHDVQPIQENV